MSVSLSGRVACFPVVSVVCCGVLLPCVVFCGAVLWCGAVLSCSAVFWRCCLCLLFLFLCPVVLCCLVVPCCRAVLCVVLCCVCLSSFQRPCSGVRRGCVCFLKDKLVVPENRFEDLIDHWHNAQLMHPGRDKLQKDLESSSLFPPGYYAVLNRYCRAGAVCRATKHLNGSTAGSPVYTAILQSPMRSTSMDVFAMPEVTVEGEVFDCVNFAVDRHRGYVVAVPGKESKKRDKRDKHGVELQAKTVAQAMIRHWLTVFDVQAVICRDSGTQFVGTWFRTMCKYMGVRHAKTVAYHSRSNRRTEVTDTQLFEEFRQLHIEEVGR